MAEEEKPTTITDDDLSVLRVLLHNVRGLSTVSSAPLLVDEESTDEPS